MLRTKSAKRKHSIFADVLIQFYRDSCYRTQDKLIRITFQVSMMAACSRSESFSSFIRGWTTV